MAVVVAAGDKNQRVWLDLLGQTQGVYDEDRIDIGFVGVVSRPAVPCVNPEGMGLEMMEIGEKLRSVLERTAPGTRSGGGCDTTLSRVAERTPDPKAGTSIKAAYRSPGGGRRARRKRTGRRPRRKL